MTQNAPGSRTNPYPGSTTGTAVGAGNHPCNNYWIINNVNTPDTLNGDMSIRQICASFRAAQTPPNPVAGAQNQSLHVTYKNDCSDLGPAGLDLMSEPGDFADAFDYYNDGSPNVPAWANSDQLAYYNADIDATGRCNLRIEFDYISGSNPRMFREVVYSIDGGVTWQLLATVPPSVFGRWYGCGTTWDFKPFTANFPTNADNVANLRIGFRWRNVNDSGTSADEAVDQGWNIDNVKIFAGTVPNGSFVAAPAAPYCKGQTITLDNTTTPGATNVYTWTLPGAATLVNAASFTDLGGGVYQTADVNLNPQLTFSANGTYPVSLQVTNCNGPDATPATLNLVVQDCIPLPDMTVDQSAICVPAPAPLVPGSPVQLQLFGTDANVNRGWTGMGSKWAWSLSPGTVGVDWNFVAPSTATSQNPVVQILTPGTYNVTLLVRNDDFPAGVPLTKNNFVQAVACDCALPALSGGGGGGFDYGDGSDGAGTWTNATVINTNTKNVFNFTSLAVTGTPTISGANPLIIKVAGATTISGSINVNGGNGGNGGVPSSPTGGTAGTGRAGGANGGVGRSAGACPTANGNIGGSFCATGGGGNGGVTASAIAASGGAGGGYGTAGSADASGTVTGGGTYGSADLSTVLCGTNLLGGSGGGSGGASCGPSGFFTTGSGGGGAGGGAIRLTAHAITINVGGSILARGGNGGNGVNGLLAASAGGGGGSGGTIYIQYRDSYVNNGNVSRAGGIGGAGGCNFSATCAPAGGNGGLGRLLVEEDAGGGAPSLVTWVGGAPGAESDWNTAANWSPATVPVDATTSAVIPSTTYAPQLNTTVAPASIEVQAGALLTVNVSAALTTTGITNNGNISILSNTFANHVCNNGEIVVYEGNTLTVSGFLKNNGAITTTGTNSNPDVILGAHPGIPAHADASLTNDTTRYLGIGENIGVDYLVRPRGATGVVTLQDNLSARSLSINTVDPSGTLNATNRTITLLKISRAHKACLQ